MKILFLGCRYDYYNPQRGDSFEYKTFYQTLKELPGVSIQEISFDQIKEKGHRKFNKDVIVEAERIKPDVIFVFMFSDELYVETLEKLKKNSVTIGWFSDDHWRLHNYSRFYAGHFSYAVTTWSKAIEVYKQYGIHNIIRSQWGCLDKECVVVPVKKQDIDVSFIGQKNPAREKIIDQLENFGVRVYVRGVGWSKGRARTDEILDIFARSKINLNINTPIPWWDVKSFGRLLLRRHGPSFVPDYHTISNIRSFLGMRIPQIKARPFELAGKGVLVATQTADDFQNYYKNNKLCGCNH